MQDCPPWADDPSSPDFWHKVFHLQTPPVLTSQLSSLPAPPSTAPKKFIPPLSPATLRQLQKVDALYQLTIPAIFHEYPLDTLLSSLIPPFKAVALPILLSTFHLRKFCFLKSYFQGWNLLNPPPLPLSFMKRPTMLNFSHLVPSLPTNNSICLVSPLPLILLNSLSSFNKSLPHLISNRYSSNFMLLGTFLPISHLMSHFSPHFAHLRYLIISLPHFPPLPFIPPLINPLFLLLSFPAPFLSGLPPFLKVHTIHPCGALLKFQTSLGISPFCVMLNSGSISIINIKKPMNSLPRHL